MEKMYVKTVAAVEFLWKYSTLNYFQNYICADIFASCNEKAKKHTVLSLSSSH